MSGYGWDTFNANVSKLKAQGYPKDEALAICYARARISFFKRYPGGALPYWLAFPQSRRLMEHYTKSGQPIHGSRNALQMPEEIPLSAYAENPSPAPQELQKAQRLFKSFTGHNSTKSGKLLRPKLSNVGLAVGEVTGIMYLAERDGETKHYHHAFRAGSRPLLIASPDGKHLELLGGAFRFTDRGIVDQKPRRTR